MADRLQDERRKSLCCCSGLSTWCRGCAAHLLLLYLKYRLLNHLDDDDGRIMPSSLPCAACQSLSAANNVSNHNHRLFDRNHHHLLLIPPGLSISSVPGWHAQSLAPVGRDGNFGQDMCRRQGYYYPKLISNGRTNERA